MKNVALLLLLIFINLLPVKAQLNNYNVGDIAPDFSVTDPQNITHTLYQYTDSGKYVLLDFFGYWCGSCITKAPIIQTFYTKYGCNQYEVVVLGIEGDGTNAQLHLFDSLAGLPANSYPAMSGLEGNGDSVMVHYGVAGFPTLVAIGPDRKIINENIFPSSTAPEILAAFPENSIQPHLCNPNEISETDIHNILIEPNPTRGIFRIFIPNMLINSNYTIINIMGNVVGRGMINKTVEEIDISHLVNGLYILSLQNNPTSKIKILKIDG